MEAVLALVQIVVGVAFNLVVTFLPFIVILAIILAWNNR